VSNSSSAGSCEHAHLVGEGHALLAGHRATDFELLGLGFGACVGDRHEQNGGALKDAWAAQPVWGKATGKHVIDSSGGAR